MKLFDAALDQVSERQLEWRGLGVESGLVLKDGQDAHVRHRFDSGERAQYRCDAIDLVVVEGGRVGAGGSRKRSAAE